MTPDQIIALLASVGACLSAIATFWTVRQIAKQREASYRPELLFSRLSFEAMAATADDPGPLPVRWVLPSNSGVRPKLPQPTISIPLRNVGLGAAKSIAVSWSFAVAETVAAINERAQRARIPAFFTVDNDVVKLKSETFGNLIVFWRNEQSMSLDYVLPASVEQPAAELRVPFAFMLLYTVALFLAFREDEVTPPLEHLPTLTAHLEYRDIGNRAHHSSFELVVTLENVLNGGQSFRAILEPKKTS